MRFTWKETGDREFDGPTTIFGLIEAWPMGIQRWLKHQLKVAKVEDLDAAQARMAYYFLTIRQADHTLLPIGRWDELALTDFDLVRHEVTGLDQDGDCAECHMTVDAFVHLKPVDSEAPDPTQPPNRSDPARMTE